MKIKRLTICAMMLAIIVVLGFFPPIPLGFIPVPIVIQNLGILLTGLLLRKGEAFTVVAVFLLMVAAGLPFLSGGRGGLTPFFGPSVGYLIAYPICAFLIAWAMEYVPKPNNLFTALIVTFLIGVLLLDGIGAIGMHINIKGMSLASAFKAQLAFIPGDTVKAVAASVVYSLLPLSIIDKK
ncbi:hypothetical protein BG261_01670 [Floricoccus tropicus]|uniref:Biotin transporter n=1 Tax=Floricoccus tropicus TaxID=1859473 RepID=A0A1E8GMS0_9LACT|nr:biotin transporter BioY [Floricoccus tropicus]OFI49316.1 hypothetical protein BG261_01670 [Floricoccus tropicus]